MYAVVLMTALAGPGQPLVACPRGGYGSSYGGAYAHGYGNFRPVTSGCCGVVLPPAWPGDSTTWHEGKVWYNYVMQLDGHERDDMVRLWEKGTPEARRLLLSKLPALEAEAAIYRAKVMEERAKERYKVENRPLSDEELQVFENYLGKLKADKRKDALAKWRATDNRGRRLILKEIIKEMEEKDDDKDLIKARLRPVSAPRR